MKKYTIKHNGFDYVRNVEDEVYNLINEFRNPQFIESIVDETGKDCLDEFQDMIEDASQK